MSLRLAILILTLTLPLPAASVDKAHSFGDFERLEAEEINPKQWKLDDALCSAKVVEEARRVVREMTETVPNTGLLTRGMPPKTRTITEVERMPAPDPEQQEVLYLGCMAEKGWILK